MKKINDIKMFGIFEEDLCDLIECCKKLNRHLGNQFFSNIISDLETRKIFSLNDIYILEDLENIAQFVNTINN